MWEISNSLQAVCFLRAIILGLSLSLFYDIFSALRKSGLNSFFDVLVEDIIFFAVATPIIFLFLIATTNGEVRLYIILGIIIGFLILKLTLSKFIVFVLYAKAATKKLGGSVFYLALFSSRRSSTIVSAASSVTS